MTKPALHIFRAGRHLASDGTEYVFSEADVAQIAASYNPAVHEAPLVVGHPRTDAPAYGWVKSLRADGGQLYAEPQEVDAQFAELVNARRFKKISASIYPPQAPGNPTPGQYHLRHVGFLGAQPPAVKGLRPAQFAEADGALDFEAPMAGLAWPLVTLLQNLRDFLIGEKGVDAADAVISQWQIRSIEEELKREPEPESDDGGDAVPTRSFNEPEPSMPQATIDLAEREAALATKTADIDKREAALRAQEQAAAERAQAARRQDAVAFAERLASGDKPKLLPAQKAGVVELLMAFPEGVRIDLAEAGGAPNPKPAGQVLRELLESLPPAIDYSEKSRAAGTDAANAVDFSAPAGGAVDGQRLDLHAKAIAWQREHPNTPYLQAVKAVGG